MKLAIHTLPILIFVLSLVGCTKDTCWYLDAEAKAMFGAHELDASYHGGYVVKFSVMKPLESVPLVTYRITKNSTSAGQNSIVLRVLREYVPIEMLRADTHYIEVVMLGENLFSVTLPLAPSDYPIAIFLMHPPQVSTSSGKHRTVFFPFQILNIYPEQTTEELHLEGTN